MKRIITLLLALMLLVSALPMCGLAEETVEFDPETMVNLLDMYTVNDPEGVVYDQRVALYMPLIESDEHYADGCRYLFLVFYGLENTSVYMYNVEVYETDEQASAYAAGDEKMTVDGNVVISTSDATFFAAMSAFIPTLDVWIENNMMSGMMDIADME